MPRITFFSLSFLICLFITQNQVFGTTKTKDSVDYYLRESKNHSFSNFNKAKFYLAKAEKVAKKLNDKNVIADVIYNYGSNYYINGSYDIALQNYINTKRMELVQ